MFWQIQNYTGTISLAFLNEIQEAFRERGEAIKDMQTNLERAYYQYYQNLHFEGVKEFCWKLNRVFNTHFSYRYIYSLLKGYKGFRITEQIDQAAQVLLDNPPPAPAIKIIANVLSLTDLPPGTIIIANAVSCQGPDCRTIFIPPYASQQYCSKVCKQKARNLRRQQKRKELHETTD